MKNILLIDDDPIIRELFKRILQSYNLTTLSSFPDIASVDIFNYDLIISDFNIGHYTGLDVLKYLVEHKYRGAVIVNSGNDHCRTIIENSHYYPIVNAYLTKTESIEKILATIKKIIKE